MDISARPEREAVEGFTAKPFDRLRVSGILGLSKCHSGQTPLILYFKLIKENED
jgi:hypothetical protein